MPINLRNALLLIPIALAAAACEPSAANPGSGDPVAAGTYELELDTAALPALGADYVYEGWIVGDHTDGPVSTGRFSVEDNEEFDEAVFEIDAELADHEGLFGLTIEPAVGDDPAPAATHLLAGAFDGDLAELSTSHAAALGTDFSEASGSYILETPTTSDIEDDYSQ
ncbi:MAG: hypothetical protein VX498_07790, partial [Myxococcota bacterium]|nr:hypothetical protein [Myxococcota bacterium]